MEVPACGDIINARYRLDEVLGVGGTAIVYRAWDGSSRRNVALKLFKPGAEGYDPITIRRFEREVRIIANLTDPHTVTLYDSGRTGQHLYMVFELVGGVDLTSYLDQHRRLPPQDVRNILIQVLSSLHEAHSHGLLHRDIKPENIRIYSTPDAPLSVKLLDFGIARSSESSASITRTGELVGTPRYMSPEALMEQPITPASDIYSVGILALEMLFGRDSLHGNRWDEQFDRLISGHVFSFPDIDRIPEELRRIIDRMAAQMPSDRYQSASAALRALRAVTFEDGDETLVEDSGSLLQDLATARPVSDDTAPTTFVQQVDRAEYQETPARSVKLKSVIIAAGAIFVATVVLALAISAPDSKPGPALPNQDDGVQLPAAVLTMKSDEKPEPEPELATDRCGQAPLVTHRQMSTSTTGTRAFQWLTYLPKNYDADKQHPVVIMFHEDYSNPTQMLGRTRFGEIADERGWILLVLQGDEQSPWRDPEEAEGAVLALNRTAQRACVDRSRVFLLGHAMGSHAASLLSCEPWVTAVATTAYLPKREQKQCRPTEPIPAIHIAPLDTPHVPVGGGVGCPPSPGRPVITLEEYDRLWVQRNKARPTPEHRTIEGDVCFVWQGEATFESCHISGGFRWPQSNYSRGLIDPNGCDKETPKFPANKVIADFFAAAPPITQ